jgi:hypothetical protein
MPQVHFSGKPGQMTSRRSRATQQATATATNNNSSNNNVHHMVGPTPIDPPKYTSAVSIIFSIDALVNDSEKMGHQRRQQQQQ